MASSASPAAATAAAGSAAPPAAAAAAAAAAAPPPLTTLIHGVPVPVSAVPQTPPLDVALALASSPFTNWVRELDARFAVASICFQSIDMFGPRVGFVKFAVACTFQGKTVPGIVFARGGAVTILPVLRCGAERWVVCCRQPRIPVGRHFLEIPAGMMDGKGSFVGVAAKEMAEETGIEIREGDLVDLTALAYGEGQPCGVGGAEAAAAGGALHGMYPSVGGCDVRVLWGNGGGRGGALALWALPSCHCPCLPAAALDFFPPFPTFLTFLSPLHAQHAPNRTQQEFIRIMYYSKEVVPAYLAELHGKITGCAEEQENIRLELVRYEDLWRVCPDAKTLSAMLLLERLAAAGKVTL
jgi:8-oxo-dGTP pyrophosphatase MutT (NUDIX family)